MLVFGFDSQFVGLSLWAAAPTALGPMVWKQHGGGRTWRKLLSLYLRRESCVSVSILGPHCHLQGRPTSKQKASHKTHFLKATMASGL